MRARVTFHRRFMRQRSVAERDYWAVPMPALASSEDGVTSAAEAARRPVALSRRDSGLRRPDASQSLALATSLALHLAVWAALYLWLQPPKLPGEPTAIVVELVPAPPIKAVPPPPPRAEPAARPWVPTFADQVPKPAPEERLKLDPSLTLALQHGAEGERSKEGEAVPATAGDPTENYAIIIRQHVERHITYPSTAVLRQEDGNVMLQLELARDGTLISVHALAGSSADFITDTLAAVHAAAPYPAFPRAINRSKIIINFPIFYRFRG